jgi:poly [ADP-ribose] polymerase 2/3/4
MTWHLPCTLDETGKFLTELIFSGEIATNGLRSFDVDTAKMTLGALRERQVLRGFKVLNDIQAAVPRNEVANIRASSSGLHKTMSLKFGRRRFPLLDDVTILQEKYDMCDTFIHNAVIDKKFDGERVIGVGKRLVPHPVDLAYAKLGAVLELCEEGTSQFQMLWQHFETTKLLSAAHKLYNIWRVRRHQEDAVFDRHKNVGNRMVFWRGTWIELIAAIIAKGLRLFPHAHGCVC